MNITRRYYQDNSQVLFDSTVMADVTPLYKYLSRGLHTDGVLYRFFKHGDFEGERDGRFFLDMTSKKFHMLLNNVEGCALMEEWYSSDVRRDKDVEWFNAILRKKAN